MAADHLIFTPDDVDLARSPLRGSFPDPTFVLGAFNPGMTRLPSGNLLLMVRVAEALREPVLHDHVRAIRWTPGGYVLDAHPLASVDMSDPRQFAIRGSPTGCSASPRCPGCSRSNWTPTEAASRGPL
jgi:hypothetical protein